MGLLPNEITYGKIWIERNKISIHKDIPDYSFNGCDLFFFIFAPCSLIYVQFTHQQMNFFYLKKHIKIYIKMYVNIAPTCFGLRPSSWSLH